MIRKLVGRGKNQKTVLTEKEEQQIIDISNNKKQVDDFSVVVSYDDITKKNYSLSAGQYFEVKIEYVDITPEEFAEKMKAFKSNLTEMFQKSKKLEDEIMKNFEGLEYEE